MNQQYRWGALKMAGSFLFHPGDRYIVWLCIFSLYIKMRVFEVYKKQSGSNKYKSNAFSPWESLMDSHPICVSVAYFEWSQRGGDKCPVHFWQRTAHRRAKRAYPREVGISWTYITLTGKTFSLTFSKRLLYFKIPNFPLVHIFYSLLIMNHSSFFPYLPGTY